MDEIANSLKYFIVLCMGQDSRDKPSLKLLEQTIMSQLVEFCLKGIKIGCTSNFHNNRLNGDLGPLHNRTMI